VMNRGRAKEATDLLDVRRAGVTPRGLIDCLIFALTPIGTPSSGSPTWKRRVADGVSRAYRD
jgi:hypothetical protein